MKPQFIIIGTIGTTAHLYTGKDFLADGWEEARRFKTRSGADRALEAMIEAGSDWELAVLVAPPSAASTLGRKAAGIAKTISPEESAARAARLAAARAKRWRK